MNNNPKIPTTKYALLPEITQRWSIRSFSEKMIEEDVLQSLFEAASWAASSMNEQPWEYLYAYRSTPAFERMWNCLMEGNKAWSKHASVMIVSLARKNFTRNNQPNRHALYDTGSANTNLMLQAVKNDIYGHQMGGFDAVQARTELQIPDTHEIACFICLGYADSADKLDEPLRSRELAPRSRKGVEEFVNQL